MRVRALLIRLWTVVINTCRLGYYKVSNMTKMQCFEMFLKLLSNVTSIHILETNNERSNDLFSESISVRPRSSNGSRSTEKERKYIV